MRIILDHRDYPLPYRIYPVYPIGYMQNITLSSCIQLNHFGSEFADDFYPLSPIGYILYPFGYMQN